MDERHGIASRLRAASRPLATLAWYAAAAVHAGVATAADPSNDLEAVLASGDYQTSLPEPLELPDAQSGEPINLDLSGWETVGYVVVAFVALLLIVVLVRELADPATTLWRRLTGRERISADVAGPGLQAITAAEEGTALQRADALARAGRFAEAVRVLLLACIGTVREFAPAAAEDSLTSREVLGRAPLPRRAREAFGVLVAAEEAGRFAERALEARHYDEARAEFGIFAEASRNEASA